MSETLNSTPEAAKSPEKSAWDTLTKLPPFEEHIKSVQTKINAAYANLERRNVNQRKQRLASYEPDESLPVTSLYADHPTNPPSTLKQAQRLVLDQLNLTPRQDRVTQVFEADQIAAAEINQGRAENILARQKQEQENRENFGAIMKDPNYPLHDPPRQV